ncbi:uncharacterized protein LOC135502166 [Lineus longissimus]|uniref:uncharacterized protein LOC135502166 n=1 Tax=Lineus longissimus TaxID=88925 RepID=UPI002B4CEB70
MAASGVSGTFCQIIRNAKGHVESVQFCPTGVYCCRERLYDALTCCNDVSKKVDTLDLVPAGGQPKMEPSTDDGSCISMTYFWIGMGCFLAVVLLLLIVVACIIGKMRSKKSSNFSRFDDPSVQQSGNPYPLKMMEHGTSREDVGTGNVNYAGPEMA